MSDSESKSRNIVQKLAIVRKTVEVMRKNKKGYGYTYVSDDELLAKITGQMTRLHLSLFPAINSETLHVTPWEYVKTKTAKDGTQLTERVNEVLVQADMTWKWVNDDDPSDWVLIPWAMTGQQSDSSQAFGSGLTYSRRYFLLHFFGVSTVDDDPDNWRSKQRQAEEEQDAATAKEIVDQVHTFVTAHLADHPDDRDAVSEIVKKYAREKNKPSNNYYAIKNPQLAGKLLLELRAKFDPGFTPPDGKATD